MQILIDILRKDLVDEEGRQMILEILLDLVKGGIKKDSDIIATNTAGILADYKNIIMLLDMLEEDDVISVLFALDLMGKVSEDNTRSQL